MIEGVFNTRLNEQNVCNYCEYWSEKKDYLMNYDMHYPLFEERIRKVKGKYDYDALVGLSGGKDSTYVLYKLVEEYGLNVLAMTYENGYLSDWAVNSIKRTVEHLNVDHFFYRPQREIHKSFYNLAIRRLGDPCFACAFAGYFYTIKLCFEKRIPFFVHGRSPYQMFRNLYKENSDLFIPMLMLNYESHSFDRLKPVYQSVLGTMRKYIVDLVDGKYESIKDILNEFFLPEDSLISDFVPEFLAYFIYHPYDENDIKNDITEGVGWMPSEDDYVLGHYDCKIHDAAGYLYKELNGVDVLVPDVASMIRLGHINNDDAKQLFRASQPKKEALKSSIRVLCDDLSIEENELFDSIKELKEIGIGKFDSR
jgi:hypothetical protein